MQFEQSTRGCLKECNTSLKKSYSSKALGDWKIHYSRRKGCLIITGESWTKLWKMRQNKTFRSLKEMCNFSFDFRMRKAYREQLFSGQFPVPKVILHLTERSSLSFNKTNPKKTDWSFPSIPIFLSIQHMIALSSIQWRSSSLLFNHLCNYTDSSQAKHVLACQWPLMLKVQSTPCKLFTSSTPSLSPSICSFILQRQFIHEKLPLKTELA